MKADHKKHCTCGVCIGQEGWSMYLQRIWWTPKYWQNRKAIERLAFQKRFQAQN